MYVGTIPSTICKLTKLTYLEIQANPSLQCYPACLSTVAIFDIDSSTQYAGCASNYTNNGLCGFVAATNIASKSGYSMWSCNGVGVTSTNPCVGNSGGPWTGLTCDGTGAVTVLNIHQQTLNGTLPTSLCGITTLQALALYNNLLFGKSLRPSNKHMQTLTQVVVTTVYVFLFSLFSINRNDSVEYRTAKYGH